MTQDQRDYIARLLTVNGYSTNAGSTVNGYSTNAVNAGSAVNGYSTNAVNAGAANSFTPSNLQSYANYNPYLATANNANLLQQSYQ